MTAPPEVLFDRFFRNRQHLLDEGYRGKADLDRLTETSFPISLLFDLQSMMNTALLVENTNIPGHVDHDPFHFDYLSADEPNAIAFCADGHSFIGITIQLVDQLWAAGTRLSESPQLQALLQMQLTDEQVADMTASQRMQVVLFRLQFFFVALHEFSHVVHGHVRRGEESSFASEILPRPGGRVEDQAEESDADGYAIYFLLTNVFDGSEERNHLLRVLGKEQAPEADQDEILFAAFIMAAAAFIFAQAPQSFTEQDVYERTHPLHVVRLRLMMKAAHAWCDQNRPGLCPRTRGPQFHSLVRLLAGVVTGPDGQARWQEQLQFALSDAGRQYDNAVEAECVRLVRELGN